MLWQQREAVPEGQDQSRKVVLELNSKRWMGLHQDIGGKMIIPCMNFSYGKRMSLYGKWILFIMARLLVMWKSSTC